MYTVHPFYKRKNAKSKCVEEPRIKIFDSGTSTATLPEFPFLRNAFSNLRIPVSKKDILVSPN